MVTILGCIDAAGRTGYSPPGIAGPYLWAVKPLLYFVIVIFLYFTLQNKWYLYNRAWQIIVFKVKEGRLMWRLAEQGSGGMMWLVWWVVTLLAASPATPGRVLMYLPVSTLSHLEAVTKTTPKIISVSTYSLAGCGQRCMM